jgi:hypothetical protein
VQISRQDVRDRARADIAVEFSRFEEQEHSAGQVRVGVCIEADLPSELGHIEWVAEDVLRTGLAIFDSERLGRSDHLEAYVAIVGSERAGHQDRPVVVASVCQFAARPRAEDAGRHVAAGGVAREIGHAFRDPSLGSLAGCDQRGKGSSRPVGKCDERAGRVV